MEEAGGSEKCGGGAREKGERRVKIYFWNVAGLENKCEETWEYLESFDTLGLTETWMDEGAWNRIKSKIKRRFIWNYIPAVRKNKKGRTKGEILTAVNRKIEEIKTKMLNEGATEINFKLNKRKWRFVTVYSRSMEETMEYVMAEIKEVEEGEDINAKTAEEGTNRNGRGKGKNYKKM